jgi:predicted ATPase
MFEELYIIMSEAKSFHISAIEVCGFKSIRRMTELKLAPVNIFIGANGCGKTNFISFLKLLQHCLSNADGLTEYVGQNGGAEYLLHYGSKKTKIITGKVMIQMASVSFEYCLELRASVGDTLYFQNEKMNKFSLDKALISQMTPGSGGKESKLFQMHEHDEVPAIPGEVKLLVEAMRRISFYQFHDTTRDAKIRKSCYASDSSYLHSDGGNLAAFLYMLKNEHLNSYKKILNIMMQIAPYIKSFVFDNKYNSDYVKLGWKEDSTNEYVFDIGQMSDGNLTSSGTGHSAGSTRSTASNLS